MAAEEKPPEQKFPPGWEPTIWKVERFIEEIAASKLAPDVPVLVAVGGFGVLEHDRIGILKIEGGCLDGVCGAYIRTTEIDRLVASVRATRPARRGGWDTMFATGWSHAWTDDDGPLVIWNNDGRLVWSEDGLLLTREGGEPVDPREIAAVEPYVERDWCYRGVRLRLRDGGERAVVKDYDPTPSADFTYDGLNLMADTGWLHDLARPLGRALKVPVVDRTEPWKDE